LDAWLFWLFEFCNRKASKCRSINSRTNHSIFRWFLPLHWLILDLLCFVWHISFRFVILHFVSFRFFIFRFVSLYFVSFHFVFVSTHHFFRNACTKSGSLRFSQFSGCWLILSVYKLMSFDFPFQGFVRERPFNLN
jgi:hypothetical protein